MNLPTWIPETPYPFNPAWQPAWEAMTPNERRASFLFDVGVWAIVFGLCWLAGGFR